MDVWIVTHINLGEWPELALFSSYEKAKEYASNLAEEQGYALDVEYHGYMEWNDNYQEEAVTLGIYEIGD